MKHLLRRAAALALAAAMTLTLTGCIFRSSVEDLFTLPPGGGGIRGPVPGAGRPAEAGL